MGRQGGESLYVALDSTQIFQRDAMHYAHIGLGEHSQHSSLANGRTTTHVTGCDDNERRPNKKGKPVGYLRCSRHWPASWTRPFCRDVGRSANWSDG